MSCNSWKVESQTKCWCICNRRWYWLVLIFYGLPKSAYTIVCLKFFWHGIEVVTYWFKMNQEAGCNMNKLFVYHGTVYAKNTHFRFFCEQKCFRISLHCSLLRPFMVRKLLLLKYHLGQKFNFFSAKIFQKQRGDSSSRGHEFESQYRILGTWLIFHNRCC